MTQDSAASAGHVIVHASCVALNDRALLITGASGQGKSALALELMAYGADLVADDRTVLTAREGRIIASAPAAIQGLIEARGIGLLHARAAGPTPVIAQVDLDHLEPDRLPLRRETQLLGQSVPLLYRVKAPHFAVALVQFLKAGRSDP